MRNPILAVPIQALHDLAGDVHRRVDGVVAVEKSTHSLVPLAPGATITLHLSGKPWWEFNDGVVLGRHKIVQDAVRAATLAGVMAPAFLDQVVDVHGVSPEGDVDVRFGIWNYLANSVSVSYSGWPGAVVAVLPGLVALDGEEQWNLWRAGVAGDGGLVNV